MVSRVWVASSSSAFAGRNNARRDILRPTDIFSLNLKQRHKYNLTTTTANERDTSVFVQIFEMRICPDSGKLAQNLILLLQISFFVLFLSSVHIISTFLIDKTLTFLQNIVFLKNFSHNDWLFTIQLRYCFLSIEVENVYLYDHFSKCKFKNIIIE